MEVGEGDAPLDLSSDRRGYPSKEVSGSGEGQDPERHRLLPAYDDERFFAALWMTLESPIDEPESAGFLDDGHDPAGRERVYADEWQSQDNVGAFADRGV